MTEDIDGNPRHTYFPSIGAREYSAAHVGVWTGNVDSEWTDTGNWDFNPPSIPDWYKNVAIPSSPVGGNFPVIGPYIARCKRIHIDSTATLDIENGGHLSVEP